MVEPSSAIAELLRSLFCPWIYLNFFSPFSSHLFGERREPHNRCLCWPRLSASLNGGREQSEEKERRIDPKEAVVVVVEMPEKR